MKIKLSKTRVIYKFTKKNVFLVKEDQILPNGYRVKKEIIVHPGAVLVVPMLDENYVLMLRQYRSSIKKYLYEFPAGTINPGEKILPCAKRELMEETGYAGKAFRKMGAIYPVPGYSTEIIYIYSAKDLRLQPVVKDPDEIIDVHQLTLPEVRNLFQKGKIVDAKTICALAFCHLL